MSTNEYIIGQVIQLKDLITDPNSTPTADAPVADSTDVVTVYQPDGTTAAPAPAHAGTTPYATTATFTPTQSGWHEYVFVSTTTGAGAGRGSFYVSPVP